MSLVPTLALLCSMTAGAAEPGHVYFEATPGAEVVVFPRQEKRTIDIGIYRNRVSIHSQLQEVSALYADDVNAVSVGGGTTYLTIHTDRDDILPRVIRRKGFYEIALSPGRVKVTPIPAALSLEQILDPETRRRPARPPRVPLTPLRGSATTTATDPRRIPLDIPTWIPKIDPSTAAGHLLDDGRATLEAIDGHREVLTSTTDRRLQQIARFRLGSAYMALDLHREAAYYLHDFLEGEDPPVITANLMAAQADYGIGRWDEGREHCVTAAAAGARKTDVLICLTPPSLATGSPPPTEVGRSLAISSGEPRIHLLAALLLQSDNRHAEAKPLLEAASVLDEERGRVAQLALGDALYALGATDEAIAAWLEVKRIGELGEVAHLRLKMAKLVKEGREHWAAHIPELSRMANGDGADALEAHYLLAQIAQVYGNMADAAVHLNSLWVRNRQLAKRGDVPERLLAVCTERLASLDRQDRDVDLAVFFSDCWRSDLDNYLADPRILQRVALAYERLGLLDKALRIQLRVATLHTAAEREDPTAITLLARFYVGADRPLEALDTIAYAKQHLRPSEIGGAIRMSEALALEALDDLRGAERAFRAASRDPATREPARRHLGVLLARNRRCKEATSYLETEGDADTRLRRARCLLKNRKPQDATNELAPLLASQDPILRSEASWMTAAAEWQTPGSEGRQDPESKVWKQIFDEERIAREFDAKLDVLAQELSPIRRIP